MPLSTADINALGDYVVSILQGTSADADIDQSLITVQRVWELTHDLSTLTGRKIDIYGSSYSDQAPVTRSENFYDVVMSILIIERYEGDLEGINTEGQIPHMPNGWVDDRIAYVEQRVFNPLQSVTEQNPDDPTNPFRLGDWWTEAISVTTVCDFDFLKQNKVFWSEVEVTFRKLKS